MRLWFSNGWEFGRFVRNGEEKEREGRRRLSFTVDLFLWTCQEV